MSTELQSIACLMCGDVRGTDITVTLSLFQRLYPGVIAGSGLTLFVPER